MICPTLGTVVRIGSLSNRAPMWTADGVVVEVVPRQSLPKTRLRSLPACDFERRYVVRCARRMVLRAASQMEVIAA